MATIAEQLTSLAETKTAIKDAIVAKGVSVADTDTFRSYADKIGEISGGGGAPGEWQPNPNWWDIKKILDEDTRDYPGKVGVIMYNLTDESLFILSGSGMTAVATSDGAFYTYADNGSSIRHNWDTTQDKDDGCGLKTRWVIYYYTTDTTSNAFRSDDNGFGWTNNAILYLVLRINCSYAQYFCASHKYLESIDNDGYSIKGTSFQRFCYECFSLAKMPNVLDTSAATSLYYFGYNCSSLIKIPDVLDATAATSLSYFLQNACSLREARIVLSGNANINMSYSLLLSIESFRYIADHAPDVTATPRTLTIGSMNILRINAKDPTIITDLTAKGWTVK